MNIRRAQLVALRRATLHSVRWPPALAAALIVTALSIWRRAVFDDLGSALLALRTTAVLLALGAAFVLDDDAAVSIAAAPTPLWWRRMLRYAVAAIFVVPVWTGVVAYATFQQPGLPWLRLSLELTVLVALGLTCGSVAARGWDMTDPGMAAALCVLGGAFVAAHLPPWVGLFLQPDSAHWQASTLRWLALLIVCLAVLVATTRDPAHRRTSARRVMTIARHGARTS